MKFTDPWEHYVVDQFYDQHLFDDMISEINEICPDEGIHRDLKKFPKTKKFIDSKKWSKAYLQMFSEHREYKKLIVQNELIVLHKNKIFEIHDEIPNKILSAVTYVYPEMSRGTLLYNEDKNFVKEVDWKQNRTLFFCGIDNKTWHSYLCDENLRITINTFLIDCEV